MPLTNKIPDRPLLYWIILIAIVLIYLTAAIACALTQRPWWDEAIHGGPALCLMSRGYMGTPVLDPNSRWFPLPGINEYTYQMMPLYMLLQVPWYKVFGFGLIQMRFFSTFWGLVALTAWFQIAKTLSGSKQLAILTILFLALDFTFIHSSSEGRPDTMSMALGFSGLAVYLCLREKHFDWAIVLSHCAVAASFFTHPNGFMAFVGLLFLTLYFDRKRVRLKHLLLASAPYLAGGIGWGLYILKAPEFFKAQIGGNGAGRFQGLTSPLSAIRREFINRYVEFYAGLGPNLSRLHRLKVVIVITYISGLIGALALPGIRRHHGYRALLVLTIIYLVMMTFWDGAKSPLYLIHIAPLYAAVLAVFIHWCWNNQLFPRWLLATWISIFMLVQVGAVVSVVRRDTFGKTYKPMMAFVQKTVRANDSVIGSSELGFDLGFFGNLTDDLRLGYLSGKTPDYIVIDSGYEEWFRIYSVTDPANYRFIMNRLSHEYHPIYNQPPYTVYVRQTLKVDRDSQ